MENLVDLLPLAFIVLYYLLAGRRKAKQRQAARQRAEAPQEALVQSAAGAEVRADTPFESFLEQLEAAMAEAGGVEEPRAVESTPVPPAPIETVPEPEFHSPAGSFDAPGAVDHEAHGFGDENPFSEEAFERAPAFTAPPPAGDPGYDPHALRPAPPRRSPAPPDWRRRLDDPQTARDAFVLQTIFGPRGGLRGDRSAKR